VKRRNFLQILGITALAPEVLIAKPIVNFDPAIGDSSVTAIRKGNSFDHNLTKQMAKSFLKGFEESRLIDKVTTISTCNSEMMYVKKDSITFRRPEPYKQSNYYE